MSIYIYIYIYFFFIYLLDFFFYTYTTSQKFLNSKIFLCFWKKSLLLIKSAFIWSKIQQKQ